MIQRFFKDSVIYGFSSVLSRGISFFLLPVYARTLSPHEYGVLDYLSILGSFVAVIVALEIAQGVARFVSENVSDKTACREYASTSLWFTLGAYAIFLSLIAAFHDSISHLLFDETESGLLVLLASTSYCISGILYLVQGQLRWELRPMQHAIVSIVMSVLTACFSIVFIVFLKWGVTGALTALILSGSLSSMLALYYTRASYGLAFSKEKLKEMLHFSLPLVISSVSVVGAVYVDRIFIRELIGLADVGYYGVAWRISLIITLALMGIQSAITPLVYNHYKEPETPKNIERIFRYFVAFAGMIYLTICLFLPYIFAVMVGPGYDPAMAVVPVLCLSVLFSGMYIFAPGIGIAKKTKHFTIINIVGFFLNIGLNFVMVPLWGIVGAAAATLISSIVILVCLLKLSQKYYYVPHNWAVILASVFGTIAIVALGTSLPHEGLDWFTLRAVLFALSLYFFCRIGLVSTQDRHDLKTFAQARIQQSKSKA